MLIRQAVDRQFVCVPVVTVMAAEMLAPGDTVTLAPPSSVTESMFTAAIAGAAPNTRKNAIAGE